MGGSQSPGMRSPDAFGTGVCGPIASAQIPPGRYRQAQRYCGNRRLVHCRSPLLQTHKASVIIARRRIRRNPEQAAMTRSVRERVAPMRAMTIAIPASILLNIAAAAQDQGRQSPSRTMPPPGSAGTASPQAPVGHRQPTERSLPPSVRKEEGSTKRQETDPLGPLPKICTNC